MKNVVLVSGVQQSDAGIHKRVFFQILSLLDYYRILSRVLVLYSGSLLAIHFKYRNIYSPSNEPPGLISFRMDWLNLLAVQGTLKSLLQHHRSILDNNDEWMSRWIWKVSIDGKCPSLGWGGKQGKQSKRSCLLDHGECLFPSQRAKAQTECTQPILWSPIVLELYKYLSLPKLPNNNNCNL